MRISGKRAVLLTICGLQVVTVCAEDVNRTALERERELVIAGIRTIIQDRFHHLASRLGQSTNKCEPIYFFIDNSSSRSATFSRRSRISLLDCSLSFSSSIRRTMASLASGTLVSSIESFCSLAANS